MGKHTLNKTKMTLNMDRDVVLRAKAMKINCSAVAEAALAARTGPYARLVSLLTTCAECGKSGFDIHAMTLLLPGYTEAFVPRAFEDRESLGLDPKGIALDETAFPLACLSCRSLENSKILQTWHMIRSDLGMETSDHSLWFSFSPRIVLAIGSLLSRSTATPRGDSLVFPEGWILRPGRVYCPNETITKTFTDAYTSVYDAAGNTANLEVSTWGGSGNAVGRVKP